MKHVKEILPAVMEEILHRAKLTSAQVEAAAFPKSVQALKAYRYVRPVEELNPLKTWMA